LLLLALARLPALQIPVYTYIEHGRNNPGAPGAFAVVPEAAGGAFAADAGGGAADPRVSSTSGLEAAMQNAKRRARPPLGRGGWLAPRWFPRPQGYPAFDAFRPPALPLGAAAPAVGDDPFLFVEGFAVPLGGDLEEESTASSSAVTPDLADRVGGILVGPLAEAEEEDEAGGEEVDDEEEEDSDEDAPGRSDLPALPRRKRKRGSFSQALEILSNPVKRLKARAKLLRDIYANSTRGPKASKRRTVELLAKAAAGTEFFYPLVEETVVDVAGALKGASYRAADSYLGELRLGHVEARHEVPLWLARVFAGCRRSVLRGLGPPTRATELPLELLGDETPEILEVADILHPRASYVVAEGWMTREIEVANSRLACAKIITPDSGNQTLVVELCLPVSKADTRGFGKARRLRCCCGELEEEDCAAHVLAQHIELREEESGVDRDSEEAWDVLLFPSKTGDTPTKQMMIDSWQLLAPEGHPRLGGHSPRRSGAKRRARAGWSITAIQHLGRWASSAVLGYVEEALAESVHGASRSFAERTEDWDTPLQELTKRLKKVEADITSLRRRDGTAERRAKAAEEALLAAEQALPERRWLVSDSGKLHREASRSAKLPAYHWQTGCGWAFWRGVGYRFLPAEEAAAHAGSCCGGGCDLT